MVTWGSTTTFTAIVLPQPFTILRSTIPHEGSRVAEPPMLLTLMEWRLCHKCRCCAKYSVMNEVEDAESNGALAFIVEPSALTIWTWHVVSTTGWQPPNCEWYMYVTVLGVCLEGDTSLACFELLYQCGARYDEASDISCTFDHKDIAWQNVLALNTAASTA